MEKMPFLYFKERSSLNFGLYVKEKNVYKGARRRQTFTQVPGRDGDLATDEGSYDNVSISYKLSLLNNSPRSFSELSRLISHWLILEPGYHKLWDSYDRDYYRLAAFSDEVNVEQELRELGSLDIKFNCKPFKYTLNGADTITVTATKHIYNAEALDSKPYLKVFGSGTLYVYINGNQYKINEVSGYVEIDSETMNCYKGSTSMNNKMVSDGFPILTPGDNVITPGSSVTRIEIVPRWCTL